MEQQKLLETFVRTWQEKNALSEKGKPINVNLEACKKKLVEYMKAENTQCISLSDSAHLILYHKQSLPPLNAEFLNLAFQKYCQEMGVHMPANCNTNFAQFVDAKRRTLGTSVVDVKVSTKKPLASVF